LIELLSEVKIAETKERMIESAFIGFQMGAGGNKPFGKYLESLGLADSKPEDAKPERSAKEIIAGAEKTLQILRDKKK